MEYMRTENKTDKYVIITMRDGRLKYVGRDYNPKRNYGYTVKINNARTYDSAEKAANAMIRFNIQGQIGRIQKTFELMEIM